MSWYGGALVLDANILVRIVLGRKVRDLVLDNADSVLFFAPRLCYRGARRHSSHILEERNLEVADSLNVLDDFEDVIRPMDESTFGSARTDALARIEDRDPKDWQIVAAALILDCPIWTEDRDFFGCGVPTWTTRRIGVYLDAARAYRA